MERTTSSEFIEWLEYLDRETIEPEKADLYMAQIAAEVRRSIVKNPNQVKVQDFILNFERARKRMASSLKVSKDFWFTALGLKGKE